MFITAKLQFLFQRLKEHIARSQSKTLNKLIRQILFKGNSFIQHLSLHQTIVHRQKQAFLDTIQPHQKVIFYVFRDLHLIDWFLPVHNALDKEFPGNYIILYVNFGSTLKQVGDGIEYLTYLDDIEKRLGVIQQATFQHFSDQEIALYRNFPRSDLILTTETIRKENFTTDQRIYLPHYTVPKAKDTLPAKMRYNHVFLSTTREFSYNAEGFSARANVTLHDVGYPKMNGVPVKDIRLFDNDHPTIIFAPSLDSKLILDFIKQGILKVFHALDNVNFVLKLHPTLSSKMHYVFIFLEQATKRAAHIRIDTKTNLQEIGAHSAAMITDFGSVGAEYRLSFGKRVIYLELPKTYEGGADLRFRDAFADSISSVAGLTTSIAKILQLGNLQQSELSQMKNRVLHNWPNADQIAAETIHGILQQDS